MSNSKVAKRYAQGLLEFASDSSLRETLFQEMKDVITIHEKSRELKSFLSSPVIDSKKKLEVAQEIFKNFSTEAKNFIFLIIRQGREQHLERIAQEYINKLEDLKGVQRVTLTTASALSDSTLQEIVKNSNLVAMDSKFDLLTKVNPDLLGGYILRVGDQQIDQSVRSKLNQVKKEFQLN